MSYVDVNWTPEQVDFALQIALDKFIKGEGIQVQPDGCSQGEYKLSSNKVYISINKSRVFMILAESAGSFEPSVLFWKDRAVKKTMKQLLTMITDAHKRQIARENDEKYKHMKESAMKSLFDAFPEAITEEFEKHALESKNGKEGSEEN